MKLYEYKCVFICGLGETTGRRLNEYGMAGWELVAVNRCWHYILKGLLKNSRYTDFMTDKRYGKDVVVSKI